MSFPDIKYKLSISDKLFFTMTFLEENKAKKGMFSRTKSKLGLSGKRVMKKVNDCVFWKFAIACVLQKFYIQFTIF